MKITVRNQQRSVRFDLRRVKDFARLSLAECLRLTKNPHTVLARLPAVEVAIISDEAIADVHKRFMQIEGPTDVITFDHGEILISAETARDNARLFENSLNEELALCITHGLLHLCGYEDERPGEAKAMRLLQSRIMRRCSLALKKSDQK